MRSGTSADVVTLKVEKLVYGGFALARVNGWVWLVDGGALPGELVEARIVRRSSRMIWARADRILEPSPDRLTPNCPVFGVCGGCHLLHFAYPAQLKAKEGFVREALRCVDAEQRIMPPLGAAETLFFRNKMSFSMGQSAGSPVCGLHERARFDRLCSASACVLQSQDSQFIVRTMEDLMARRPGLFHRSRPQRLTIREGRGTGERMAIIEGLKGASILKPWLDGVVDRCTTVVADWGAPHGPRVLTGDGRLREKLGMFHFEYGPFDFFQTHTSQAEQLFRLIQDWTREIRPAQALDLYAGNGVIAHFLSSVADAVVGVEAHGPSVESARRNAQTNRLQNVRMVHGDAARVAASQPAGSVDLVVADPPRAGLSPEAREALLRLDAPHLILISCNPATLGRDIVPITAAGYEIETIQPIDMFPHSYHVETAVRFARPRRQALSSARRVS